MLVELKTPAFNADMEDALIESLYCEQGQLLPIGAKLMDVSVNLSSAFAQNCPPISYYRLVLRDKLWLRELLVTPGDRRPAGSRIALLSTEPEEALDGDVARAARCMTAGIVYHAGMWSSDTE